MSPAIPASPARAGSPPPGAALLGAAGLYLAGGKRGPRPAPCAEPSGAGALLRSAPRGWARQRRLAGGTPRAPRCRHGPTGPQTKGVGSCPPPHRVSRGTATRGSGRFAKREPEGSEGEGNVPIWVVVVGEQAMCLPVLLSLPAEVVRTKERAPRGERNVGLLLKYKSLLDVLTAMA